MLLLHGNSNRRATGQREPIEHRRSIFTGHESNDACIEVGRIDQGRGRRVGGLDRDRLALEVDGLAVGPGRNQDSIAGLGRIDCPLDRRVLCGNMQCAGRYRPCLHCDHGDHGSPPRCRPPTLASQYMTVSHANHSFQLIQARPSPVALTCLFQTYYDSLRVANHSNQARSRPS